MRSLFNEVPFIPDLEQVDDRLQSYLSQLLGQLPSFATGLARVLGGVMTVVFLAMYMAAGSGPLVSGALRASAQRPSRRV